MAENKVSVEITVEQQAAMKALGILGREVNRQEKNFSDLGKEADGSLGIIGQAASGVSSGFKSLVGGVTVANLASDAIVGTANAIKNFAVDSVNAAIESEQATNKLGQSLRAVGAFSEQTVSDFLEYASALSQVTVYSDDQITNQLALAKSFGATNQQAKDLVKAATELSATFGGSLEARVEQLGKTLQGTGGKLGQLIPGFKDLTEAQLKSGDAIDLINSKFNGAAANEIGTYGGKLAQLTKSFGELQESIGGLVVNSGVSDFFDSIAFAVNKMNQSFTDSQIAQARQREGFTETSSSLEQLKRQYDELSVKAIDLEQTIINPKNKALADQTAIFIAKKQLKELNDEIARTKAQIDSAAPKVQEAIKNAPEGKSNANSGELSLEDQKRINAAKEVEIQIALIREQAAIAQQEQEAILSGALQGKNELELQQIYEFEALKLEAQFEAEEQKANLIKNSTDRNLKLQEISARRELDFTKLSNAQLKAEGQKRVATDKEIKDSLLSTTQDFLSAGAQLAKDGSNAQKALQITQATISTYTAANNALAQPIPYPIAVAQAASAVALGLANVARIAGAKFEKGGIVGGTSMTGDNIGVRVNSGEMILNRQQQTQLFNMANGSTSGDSSVVDAINRLTNAINSQTIQLTVDGRVLATVIRDQVRSGVKIA